MGQIIWKNIVVVEDAQNLDAYEKDAKNKYLRYKRTPHRLSIQVGKCTTIYEEVRPAKPNTLNRSVCLLEEHIKNRLLNFLENPNLWDKSKIDIITELSKVVIISGSSELLVKKCEIYWMDRTKEFVEEYYSDLHEVEVAEDPDEKIERIDNCIEEWALFL
jgi:hypothetical protein